MASPSIAPPRGSLSKFLTGSMAPIVNDFCVGEWLVGIGSPSLGGPGGSL